MNPVAEKTVRLLTARKIIVFLGLALLIMSTIKLYSHYTGAWSPFQFNQSTFDGDSALAIMSMAVSLLMVFQKRASVDFRLLVCFFVIWKIGTKVYPKWVVRGDIADVTWCLYLIVCVTLLKYVHNGDWKEALKE
jgi:hypothetical protein